MKYAVTLVSPPRYIHSAAFQELAESLDAGLRELGHDSVLSTRGAAPGRRQIVLGCHLLPRAPLPLADDAILYNFEQVGPDSPWMRPELFALLRRYQVWDFSERNAQALRARDVPVAQVLRPAYSPVMSRIEPASERDIDVLFYGSLNPRRRKLLAALRAAGLRVCVVCGLYGAARDALIARSRLVLNLHFYAAGILEMVRLAYLLSNRCAVLSEPGSEPALNAWLDQGVAFAPYEQLVERARELLADPDACVALGRRGHAIFSAVPLTRLLGAALAPDPA